ncbi:HNH endonuclease [Altererythrobacter sp. KTW20L]|uniref:HNH endonuclease n=1 Tax=Altererythrobacter sp. KTW20L TaxID=2942210 RepID=UPI0020BF8BE2|nr:HNH endonuclease signature motif containing protein [Altererythrobacter sp. KTW20L]MCL6251114.1 HNH endonuclease [Altererythrobacter sp. KTW20L]
MGIKRETGRAGASVYRSMRWKGLRLAAKRRDGWACVQCGAQGARLDVDHIRPIRTHPELAFELANLQTLCVTHHSEKTKRELQRRTETGPERLAWRIFTRELTSNPLRPLIELEI